MSGKSQFNITRYLARFLCSFILLIRTHTHTQTVRVVHARCHRVLCACFLFRHTFSSPLRCSRHFFVVALNHHTTFHCTTPHCLFFLPISLKLKLLFDTCTIAATIQNVSYLNFSMDIHSQQQNTHTKIYLERFHRVWSDLLFVVDTACRCLFTWYYKR